ETRAAAPPRTESPRLRRRRRADTAARADRQAGRRWSGCPRWRRPGAGPRSRAPEPPAPRAASRPRASGPARFRATGRWSRALRSFSEDGLVCAGANGLEPAKTRGGPLSPGVVIDLEGRRLATDRHPPDLRSGEDVHIGRDIRRVVERAGADKPQLGSGVLAEQGDLTDRAAKDPLNAAIVAGSIHRLRCFSKHVHACGL